MRPMQSFLALAIAIQFAVFTPNASAATAPESDVYNGYRGRSFNSGWTFNQGDVTNAQNPAFDDAAWRKLDLPHDWSIEGAYNQAARSGTNAGYLDGGIGWYRKSFTLPQDTAGKKVFITFDGVYTNSDVWINGQLLGHRPNGFTTFQYDLTPHLQFGAANVLAVRVDHSQEPSSRWYNGSGINRNVWLTVLDPAHIQFCGTFVSTSAVTATAATVAANTQMINQTADILPATITTTIRDAAGVVVATGTPDASTLAANATQSLAQSLTVPTPHLWSPDDPYLYTVTTQLRVNNIVVDTFKAPLGIRTVRFDANQGLFLNDQHTKLKGTCLHEDLGPLGVAFNYRAMEKRIELLKAMGSNAIRVSHNPVAPEMLEICDRLGMLVMQDAFDCWETRKVPYDYAQFFSQWAQTDLQAMVRRERNHPSLLIWSIGNEISRPTAATGQKLKDWILQLDATRPISWASNSMGNAASQGVADILDLAGYNYQTGAYDRDHARHPTWVIFGSETCAARRSRGVYVFPPTRAFGNLDPDIGSGFDNSYSAPGKISAENDWKAHNDRAFVVGEFIWTGFDYLGENDWPTISNADGIIDRADFPKDIYYFYQSQWSAAPMVHIIPHWNWQAGQGMLTAPDGVHLVTAKVPENFTVPVQVYSNCPSVELFLNDQSLGVKSFTAGGPLHLEWQVPFAPGTLRAVATKNGAAAATTQIITAGAPAAVKLQADRPRLRADSRDLAYITADIVDAQGVMVPTAGHRITYAITGPARLVGLDNGDALDHDPYKAATRKAFNGKCLAIVQTTAQPGPIVITATADGLTAATITLESQATATP